MKLPISAVASIAVFIAAAPILAGLPEVSASTRADTSGGLVEGTALGSDASASDQEGALVELCLYRVRGDISGETSLTEGVSLETKGHEVGAKKVASRFFTLAKLTVAGVEFRADESGWTWDGKDRPPSGKAVEVIASPRIIVLLDNSFMVSIGSQQPIEYFERRADGLFELKKADEQTGLTISAIVAKGESGKLVLRDLTIGLRSVEGRELIKGVNLDVGRPTIKKVESITSVAVKPGRDYGIWLQTEGYGALFIRLRVSRVNPGA